MNYVMKPEKGLTLVELLVAMLLALITAASVLTVFSSSRQSFRQDENTMRMHDGARHALRELAYDLSMAGHYADLLVPAAVTQDPSLVVANDCGPAGVANWTYMARDPGTGHNLSVIALDNAASATVNATHSCIAGTDHLAGTDTVSIKRVAGGASAVTTAGDVYLRTNGTVGLLYREPTAAPAVPVPAPFAEWEFRPRIYYVRPYADSPGDGLPTLCRKYLDGTTMATECIATGIENLQIEYGIDTTDDGDANVFLTDPTLEQLQSAVAARIFLLARTADIDVGYLNEKTYVVSNAPPYAPNDRIHRRVYSTTVGLKNIRSLMQIGS